LNQLWTQVVTEEVLAMDDNSPIPTVEGDESFEGMSFVLVTIAFV
jgi:hypothetical protein